MSSPALALAERSASELSALRKLATELAHARKERATSLHLLAAIADRPGSAADLLRERRLDRDALLKAGRSFDEDGPDAMLRALAEAREVQKRVRTPLPTDRVRPAGPAQLSPDSRHTLTEPTALHLLIALLGERRFAACRALATIGVDLARLRASAVQQALGLVAARRIPARLLEAPQTAAPALSPPRPAGVAVPLLPPTPRVPRPGMPTPATPATAVPASAMPPPRQPRTARPPAPTRPAPRTETTPPPSTPETLRERFDASPASGPAKTSLDPAQFPLLAALGRDLVEASRAGELAPVIGREAEVERVLDVLAKLRANVPVLIGPPGVGKTAVAHGLAERFARGPVRSRKKLIEIGVPDLVAGTGTRGALAERLARLRAEIARADGDIVLFVDEIHELFAGGAADEASAELRVALARGELPLLGATTAESFKKAVEADPTLARRVVAIEVEEPSAEDAFLQVRGASARLATHHRLAFDEEAIAAAIGWSVRYLPGRALPDKALALLDLAGARRKRVLDENEGPFQQGGPGGSHGTKTGGARRLRMEDVAPVVAEQASIPEERLLETDAERMLALEKTLGERVIGREAAIGRIATLLRRNAVGLRGRRPIGTFLLLGPTGVGKTETAKAIAEALFDSPDAMTRLDLSEFAEAHAIARLIGAPPGYVGHEAGGQLTEALRKRPYQVVLLDEVEKAHRDVLQAFLQVFDEGRMTDGRGRLVDFTNTVIVMTSNLGVAELRHARDRRGIGFGGRESVANSVLEDAVVGAAKKTLAPELFNRIDEVVFYPPLERGQIAEIARKLLEEVALRLEEKGVAMQVDDDGIEALLDAGGYDPELGARPMRRAIGRLVEAPIAERLLRRELPPGSTVIVGAEGGKVAIDAVLP